MDYSGAGRFDLLARRDHVEVEVECKTTSGDTGRKIQRQEANRLADLLLPIVRQLADEAGCHRILITIPDRLGKSTEELSGIAAIAASAAEHKGLVSGDYARAGYTFDGRDAWPEPDTDPSARGFLSGASAYKTPISCYSGELDFRSSL